MLIFFSLLASQSLCPTSGSYTLLRKALRFTYSIVLKPGAIVGVLDHERVVDALPPKYRIYSINCPGRLLNFWSLRVGVIRGGRLLEAGRLLNFHNFKKRSIFILQQDNKW